MRERRRGISVDSGSMHLLFDQTDRMPVRAIIAATLWLLVAPTTGCVTTTRELVYPQGQLTGSLSDPPRIETAIGEWQQTTGGDAMFLLGETRNSDRRMREMAATWRSIGAIERAEPRTLKGFSGAADAEITFSGRMHGETHILRSLLSGLTLTVIPAKIDYRGEFRIERRDVSSGATTEAVVRIRAAQYQSILLLPIMPFSIARDRRLERRIHEGVYCELWKTGCTP